jgi:hypothetical protein
MLKQNSFYVGFALKSITIRLVVCSKFFILLTTHQVLMFDIRDVGGHVCKNFE